jgi:hypothetical protein
MTYVSCRLEDGNVFTVPLADYFTAKLSIRER